jgi:hypothetical protein
MNKPRLAISFSGGRSSAVMLRRCLELYSESHEISIVFANTGCEHEETLRFVDAVDRNFAAGNVVWIEAIIGPEGVGARAKVVDYANASRNGEPFREAIAKHGIPNPSHPQCTSRIKTEPMKWFREKFIGWDEGTYDTAIGIRADEADRMSVKAKEQRLIYPLIREGWRKRDVNEYMKQFDWDLKLPSDAYGNCVWCWKKSLRKLMTVAKSNPEVFDFPGEMERRFGTVNKGDQEQPDPRVFFRGKLSAQDIVKMAFTNDFEPWEDDKFNQLELFNPAIDVGGGCGDSCEIGADE